MGAGAANGICGDTMRGVASSMQITAVKTISDTTRGLVSATKAKMRDEDPARESEDTAKNFNMSAEARDLQQPLQILDHARGIRVARETHHQVAEGIHQVNVVGHAALG